MKYRKKQKSKKSNKSYIYVKCEFENSGSNYDVNNPTNYSNNVSDKVNEPMSTFNNGQVPNKKTIFENNLNLNGATSTHSNLSAKHSNSYIDNSKCKSVVDMNKDRPKNYGKYRNTNNKYFKVSSNNTFSNSKEEHNSYLNAKEKQSVDNDLEYGHYSDENFEYEKQVDGKKRRMVKGETEESFARFESQDNSENEINKKYEVFALSNFNFFVTKSKIVSKICLDKEEWTYPKEDFHNFLFKNFSPLIDMSIGYETKNKKRFIRRLLKRNTFQLDGAFVFFKNKKYLPKNPDSDLIYCSDKGSLEVKIKDFVVTLNYPCLLVIEVTTSNDVESLVAKIKQVLINLLASWYTLLERFSYEKNIRSVFEDKKKIKSDEEVYSFFEDSIKKMNKSCLIITSGNFNTTLANFNAAYLIAIKESAVEYLLSKIDLLNAKLSDDSSNNSRATATMKERVDKHFKIQHIHLLESISDENQEIRCMINQLDSRMTGLETRMTGVETRLTGLETRMTGVETRLTGIETRLTGIENEMSSMKNDIIKGIMDMLVEHKVISINK